jgi:copper chaperone NosL
VVPGLLLALLLAACAPASAEPQPPEMAYGQDTCDLCGMIIGEPKFAAALLLEDGAARKFDDIGNMFVYRQAHPELDVRAWFVHDYRSEEWIRGETAFYVKSPSIKSPMGHGLAAFRYRADAEVFAQSLDTSALTFEEARREVDASTHSMEELQ